MRNSAAVLDAPEEIEPEPVSSMFREKKLSSLSIRIADTLKSHLEGKAREGGFRSLSEYILHRAAQPEALQVEIGNTLQHNLRQLRQALLLVEAEKADLTQGQKLFVFDRITQFQRTLLAGRSGRTA